MLIEHLQKLENFFNDFSDKLEVFDPLDRDIPSHNNVAIKRDELLQAIQDMTFISGSQLQSPFSNQMLQ